MNSKFLVVKISIFNIGNKYSKQYILKKNSFMQMCFAFAYRKK